MCASGGPVDKALRTDRRNLAEHAEREWRWFNAAVHDESRKLRRLPEARPASQHVMPPGRCSTAGFTRRRMSKKRRIPETGRIRRCRFH